MLILASLTLSIIVLSGVLGYGIARQFMPVKQSFFIGAMQVGILLYPNFIGLFSYIGVPAKYSFALVAAPMILISVRAAWNDFSVFSLKELCDLKTKSILAMIILGIIFGLLLLRPLVTFPNGFYYIQDYKSYIADASIIIDYGYFDAPGDINSYLVNIGGLFPRPEVGFSLAGWSELLMLPPIEVIGPLISALIFVSILGFSGIVGEGVGRNKVFFILLCLLVLTCNPWLLRLSYATFSQTINFCAMSAFLYILVIRTKYNAIYDKYQNFKTIVALLLFYWICGISAWGAAGLMVFTPLILSAGLVHVFWQRCILKKSTRFSNSDIYLIIAVALFSIPDFSAAITDLQSSINWLNNHEVGERPLVLDVLGFVTNIYDVEIYLELVYFVIFITLTFSILIFFKAGFLKKLVNDIAFLTIISAIIPILALVLCTIYFGSPSQWFGVTRLYPHVSTLILTLFFLIFVNGLFILKIRLRVLIAGFLILIFMPLYVFSYCQLFLIDGLTLKGYSPGAEDWYLVRDVIRYKRKYRKQVLFEGVGGALGEALGASILTEKHIGNDFSALNGGGGALLVVKADVGQSMQKQGYEVRFGRTIAVVATKGSEKISNISGSLNYPLEPLPFKLQLLQSYSIEGIKFSGNSISGLSTTPDPLFVIDLGGSYNVDVLRIHLFRNPHRLDDLFQIFYQVCQATTENQVFESKIVNTTGADREIIDFDLQGQCISKLRVDPVTDPDVNFQIENIELMKQVY